LRLALGFNPVMPVSEAVKIGQKAEKLGYESVWFHESLYQRDVVTYLSMILGSTNQLRVGSGVINTFTRHPVVTASTFASLSELSKGRVLLGLGLGSFPTIPKIGQKIFPVSETKPLRRVKEYLDVVRLLWSGEKVSFRGDFYTVEDLQLGLKPDGRIPVYIASLSPKIQKFAGANADGAILSPALTTVETTLQMVSAVKDGERLGGEGKAVDKASYMLTSVDEDHDKAVQTMKGFYFFIYQLAEVIRPEVLESYGVKRDALERVRDAWRRGDLEAARQNVPGGAVDGLTLSGTPDEVKERLSQYLKVGVDLPILMPIGNLDYALESLAPGGWH
jgi:5,10-methylenetetrahydromethanopterin reductase